MNIYIYMYVGSVSKLWRYVYKALFCWEGWNVNNLFFENTVFYIRELTFLKVLKFWLTGGTYILRLRDLRLYRVVYTFLCRCTYMLHHVKLPYSCEVGEKKNDIVIGFSQNISDDCCCCLMRLCMRYSASCQRTWSGQLHKYCDILCNYICGIALCWQSQS